MSIQAIILAAGIGNRMRPLTDTCHKTLVEVGGHSILGRIVDGLLENGISRILCVTGYRAAEVERYLTQKYPELELRFVRNKRFRDTNNIISLALALEQISLEDDVLLVESDIVCEPSVFGRIIRSQHGNVALVDRYRSGMDGTVVSIDGNVITSVIPPHLQTGEFSFADKYKTLNIYKFSAEFCRSTLMRLVTYYAKTIDANCYYELVLGILIYVQRAVIFAEIITTEKWAEVDDPNDLRVAEFTFNPSRQAAILDETKGGYWSHDIIDFCFIRNMYFPNPAIFAELRSNLPRLLQNYGSRQEVLNQKLAYFLLCNPERVQALNGGSQVYPILQQLLGTELGHKRIIIPQPTFGEYPRLSSQIDSYADTGTIDLEELQRRAQTAEVVVFVNPNNPTGTTLRSDFIYDFARQHPQKIVIVDESFIDFCDQPSMLSLLEAAPLPNVLLIKSLSKVLGVPGARLGFLYTCAPDWHARIGRGLPIWNLNSVAECILEIVLKHRQSYADSIARTIADRASFARALAAVPLVKTVYPSGGNFLLVRLREGTPEGGAIRDVLLSRHATYVKDVSSRFAAGGVWLRLAVRLPDENARLCQALAAAEQATPAPGAR